MYNNDEYNKAYQQIIKQGFLENLGNATIKGITSIGKGIKKAYNWNKKRVTKNQINTNINSALKIYDQSIDNAQTKIQEFIIENPEEILQIQQQSKIKQYEKIITNIKQQCSIITDAVRNINDILPESPIKAYLNTIKNIGTEINTKILNMNIDITADFNKVREQQIQNIRQFFYEKANIAYIKFKNTQLAKTLENENVYTKIYLDIINEDTLSLTNNDQPVNNDATITVNNQPINNNSTITVNKNVPVKKSKQFEQMCQEMYIKICKYDILMFFIIYSADQINNIINGNESSDLQKLIKQVAKDTTNKTNYKFDINLITKLLNEYFIAGLCMNLSK